jgi:hypothetical protein
MSEVPHKFWYTINSYLRQKAISFKIKSASNQTFILNLFKKIKHENL